jgi:hypothetical protein
VKRKFPNRLVITIFERKIVAIWCKAENCWWVDETGTIFKKLENQTALTAAQQANTIFLRDTSQTATVRGKKEGEEALPGVVVVFCHQLFLRTKDKTGIELEREFQVPFSVAEEARATTKRGWRVYFSVAEPVEKELEILKEVLEKGISPTEQQQLEYIDLRLKGKIIYKTKLSEKREEKMNQSDQPVLD